MAVPKIFGAWLVALLFGVVANSEGLAQQSDGENSSIVEIGAVASQPSCGNRLLSIVQMQWPSSIILAHVHAQILRKELGCDIHIVAGDMAASVSSMATSGEPAIAPELWVTRIAPIWNSVLETSRIHTEAKTFSGEGFEGWFLPPHLGVRFPEVQSASVLKANIDALRGGQAEQASLEENGEEQNEEAPTLASQELAQQEPVQKIQFISCPPDWACSVVNANLLKAYGLENDVELVEPANRFEMDILIGQAVSRKQPVVFYYWQPNGVLAQFDFVALDMGEYDEEAFKCLAQRACADPQVSSFANEKAFIVAAEWVSEEAPLVSRYLRRASFPLEEMNKILSWRAEGEIEFEKLAARFVAERGEIWRPWVEGLHK